MLKRIFLFSLVSTILFTINFFFVQKEVYAVCYCIDPAADNCVCTTSASASGKDLPYAANFNGVPVLCELAEEANSLFAIKDPVCDSRFGNEIVPYCAPVNDQDWQLTCYGTGFVNTPGNIPGDTGGQVQSWNPNTTVNFNGYSGSGFTQILTCHANNFCCTRSDVSCDDSGTPAFTGTCGPKDGLNDPEHDSACFASSQTGGGAGESRLWFPHTRLIANLSTLAQSMFNPRRPIDHEEDGSYFDQYYNTAFARNATPEDIDQVVTGVIEGIGYDNLGALTTKVTRHQGFNDEVRPFVNLPDNNSSVVVGRGAPAPLFSFGNTGDDNPYNDSPFCFIPEDRNNPGDDLLGPKIQAEILYTARVTYDAHPAPDGCLFSGNFTVENMTPSEFSADPNICQQTCCSDICNVTNAGIIDPIESGECIWWQDGMDDPPPPPHNCNNVGEYDPDLEDYNNMCYNDPLTYCCRSSTGCQQIEPTFTTGSCGTLPDIQIPLDGAQSVVYNKTPHVEYLYQNHLNAPDSLWRRFMPRIREFVFEDIPSSTNFSAFASVASPRASGTTSQVAGGLTSSPTMYFPKIGTLDKYWLKEFQTAIRPFGFNTINPDLPGQTPPGSGIPPGGLSCNTNALGACSAVNIRAALGNEFINDNNITEEEILIATGICLQESGGENTNNQNFNCLNCGPDTPSCQDPPNPNPSTCCNGTESSGDYSVGLFQINIQPRATFYTNPRCPDGFENSSDYGVTDWRWCSIADQSVVDQCVAYYKDVDNNGHENIREAFQLYIADGKHTQAWCDNWTIASNRCGLSCN